MPAQPITSKTKIIRLEVAKNYNQQKVETKVIKKIPPYLFISSSHSPLLSKKSSKQRKQRRERVPIVSANSYIRKHKHTISAAAVPIVFTYHASLIVKAASMIQPSFFTFQGETRSYGSFICPWQHEENPSKTHKTLISGNLIDQGFSFLTGKPLEKGVFNFLISSCFLIPF